MKVLVIEDDIEFKQGVLFHLKDKFCDITLVDGVEEVFELATYDVWDVIVINVACPGCFCFAQRCINRLPQTNVITLSSRYSLQEKLKCYELGAEMYLVKPLSPVDILSAIELVKRRTKVERPSVINANLSTTSRIIYSKSNEWLVRLSDKECLLLHALALADQGKLETWQLMERLKIMDFEKGGKYLGIIVSRLRKKLKKHGFPEHAIKAVRGYGYQLTIAIQLVL